MQKALLGLTAVLLAALGIYFLAGRGDGGDDSAPVSPTPSAAEPQASPQAPPPVALAPEPGDGAEAPPEAVPADAREALAPAPEVPPAPEPAAAPTPENGMRVLVVSAATGEPLPGAEVLYIDEDRVDESEAQRSMMEGGDIEAVFERFGMSYRAGEDGEALVPRPRGGAVVAGRTADGFGFAQVRAGAREPVRLELIVGSDVLVQVVDGAGRPLEGILVAVRMREHGFHQDLWPAVSQGPEGIARVTRLAEMVSVMEGDGDLYVALPYPLPEAVELQLDPEDLPREPVTLAMPPTGAVEVLVQGPHGEPVTGELAVMIGPAPEEGEEDDFRDVRARPGPGTVLFVEDGRALFPHVGLGMRLRVTAARPTGGGDASVDGAGPVEPGQQVTLTLPFAVEDRLLAGRILIGEEEPLAEENLRYHLRTEGPQGSSRRGGSLRTDPEGRFELRLEADEDERPAATCELELRWTPPSAGESVRTALVPLAVRVPPGRTELGDVTLAEPPLIAGGRIVDLAGAPLPKAQVSVSFKRFYGEEHDDFWWSGIRPASVTVDSDGRFELRGHLGAEVDELLVNASLQGYYREDGGVSCLPGSTGVRIVLARGGSLAGSLVVDPGIPVTELELELDIEQADSSWTQDVNPDRDGSFEWDSLEPGVATVSLTAPGEEAPIFEIGGLDVRPGAENRDPRLQEIDLRGRLLSFTITAVDGDGDPVERLEVRDAADPDRRLYRSWRGETIRVWSSRPALDLVVSAPGYQPKRLANVRTHQHVVLRTGPRVRLVLSGASPPVNPYSLEVRLTALGNESGLREESDSGRFGESGETVVQVGSSGRYGARLYLYRETANSRFGQGLSSADGGSYFGEFDVLDSGGEQVFYVDLSPELLEEAIRAVDE